MLAVGNVFLIIVLYLVTNTLVILSLMQLLPVFRGCHQSALIRAASALTR